VKDPNALLETNCGTHPSKSRKKLEKNS